MKLKIKRHLSKNDVYEINKTFDIENEKESKLFVKNFPNSGLATAMKTALIILKD